MSVLNASSAVNADSVTGLPTEQKQTAGAAWTLSQNGPYPVNSTAVTGASGNVANAAATASLPAVAGKTTYITGFEATGAGATAGLPVSLTVVGGISGTLTYTAVAAVGALVANTPVIVEFPIAIPSSAVNTAIVVSMPALGLGNTHASVVVHGYYI